jgi:hypothetical protein
MLDTIRRKRGGVAGWGNIIDARPAWTCELRIDCIPDSSYANMTKYYLIGFGPSSTKQAMRCRCGRPAPEGTARIGAVAVPLRIVCRRVSRCESQRLRRPKVKRGLSRTPTPVVETWRTDLLRADSVGKNDTGSRDVLRRKSARVAYPLTRLTLFATALS